MSKKTKSSINIENLHFLYGIPHCHSNFSTGEGSIVDILTLAYKNALDFIFITDHNDYIAKAPKEATINNSKWQYANKVIRRFNKHNNFIALLGFEVKSSKLGHFNIINSRTYFKGSLNNFNDMILWMLKENMDDVFISINHPHKYVADIPLNSLSNSYIRSIEVGNGILNDKYTRHENFYYTLLDMGWHLGSINGQDNHKLNIGKEENLTCAIMESFDKNSLINSFRSFRTFSTESRSLKLYFTINSIFMGESLSIDTEDEELNFFINVEDTVRKISRVEILSNGTKSTKEFNDINLHAVKILFNKKIIENESWYIVRITLIDKRIAISSPIFIERKKTPV